MAVFLPVRTKGKAFIYGKSNWYRAKTLDTHRIPAVGRPRTQASRRWARWASPW
jgi:hypothetical protein